MLSVSGGTLNHTAGVVQAANVLVAGGSYNLGGGSLATTGNLFVGYNNGSGSFLQSGGTNSAATLSRLQRRGTRYSGSRVVHPQRDGAALRSFHRVCRL